MNNNEHKAELKEAIHAFEKLNFNTYRKPELSRYVNVVQRNDLWGAFVFINGAQRIVAYCNTAQDAARVADLFNFKLGGKKRQSNYQPEDIHEDCVVSLSVVQAVDRVLSLLCKKESVQPQVAVRAKSNPAIMRDKLSDLLEFMRSNFDPKTRLFLFSEITNSIAEAVNQTVIEQNDEIKNVT